MNKKVGMVSIYHMDIHTHGDGQPPSTVLALRRLVPLARSPFGYGRQAPHIYTPYTYVTHTLRNVPLPIRHPNTTIA